MFGSPSGRVGRGGPRRAAFPYYLTPTRTRLNIIGTGRTDVGGTGSKRTAARADFNPFGHGARLVKRRFIGDIVKGALDAGLEVR